MKMPSEKLLVLLFFHLTTFIFLGCSDDNNCPDAKEEYRYMPEEYKKILLYTGFDTLRFLTNTNDTITCIGQGRTTFFEANYVRDPNPDCNVFTKINYEGYKDQFNEFEISQSYSPIPPYDYWIASFKINWRDAKFTFDNLAIGKPVEAVNYFHDSLIVNNTKYYNVTDFKGNTGNDRIFINRPNGIIKLYNSASQVTLTLISK